MRVFLRNHYLALSVALIVGSIYFAPYIVFKISLGAEYKGIYMMQTANEVEYLQRIQEIADGHWKLGSVPFFEYKDNPPLMPPNILEIITAAISRIFKISTANVMILSKFFLPLLLFLVIYFLIRELTENPESLKSNPEGQAYGASKINAISGGLLVVLGYDLIDYRTVINYIKGISAPKDFLLWARPSNPILGALLIFTFLLLVWHLYKKENYKYRYVFLAGLAFAAAIMSYFFSWGMILSLMGLFFILGLWKADYKFVKNLISIAAIGFILALPYFYNVFLSMRDPSYQEASLRVGLFLTHKPVINKFLAFSLFIFLIASLIYWLARRKQIFQTESEKSGFMRQFPDWWLFSLFLILSGFIAFNQQVITGKDLWHFHFVQYTIPLAIAALFIAFYNIVSNARTGKKIFYSWLTIIVFVAAVSLFFGIYTQVSAYRQNYSAYKEYQKYADVFAWINRNTAKDSVIFSGDEDFLNLAIPAFTHSNVYLLATASFLTPFERIYYNYLTYLRMQSISSQEIENYLSRSENGFKAAAYLYGCEGLYYAASSPSFIAIKDKLISDYKEFLKKDLKNELKKYRLDYIITTGKFSEEMKILVKDLNLVYSADNIFIYQF